MSLSDYYTESVVIYSPTTSTGWGSEPSWATATSTSGVQYAPRTILAAVNPISGNVILAGGKPTRFADYKMFCSDTVILAEHDKAVYAGTTFDVVFVKDTLDMGHHKLAYLKDVDE